MMRYGLRTARSSLWIAGAEWFFPVLLCGFLLLATRQMGEKSYDDAYITLSYAKNLASGAGFSYQPGEPYLATTAPFYALLVAALAKLLDPAAIPQIAQWTSGGALLTLALLTYLLGRSSGQPLAGAAGAVALVLNPIVYLFWGGEPILLLALLTGAVYLYCRGHEASAGALVALSALTRGEGILLGIVLLAHSLVVRRRWPWRLIVAGVVVLVPWMVFSWLYFGTLLPQTLGAKMAQGRSGLWGPFLPLSVDWMKSFVLGSHRFPAVTPCHAYLVAAALAGVGAISAVRKPRFHFTAILVWVALYSLAYTVIGAPFYSWYATPIVFAMILLTGIGVQASWDRLARWRRGKRRSLGTVVTMAFLLALAWPVIAGARSVWSYVQSPVSQGQALQVKTGLWLRNNIPSDASVGVFEIGFIGYFSDRRMIEPTGLLDPAVAERVPSAEFKWAYRHYRPDCIVINPVRWYHWLGSIHEEDWFRAEYRRIAEIEEAGYYDSPLTIYCRTVQSSRGQVRNIARRGFGELGQIDNPGLDQILGRAAPSYQDIIVADRP